ncbi:MAG: DedA family protein, partial [Chloroflexota bacterium]|nr:DedA family protein [Chloroflexota bacterium]
MAVYGVLALLAAIENVVPPVPSDAAVALGAFLSHRGVTAPLLVFLVTWIANLVGAGLVYLGARRYGHRLFATGTGRRLLAPRSLAVIEREYLRFGVAGIFLSRFLPGIRAVVPPFAGLVRLGAFRTLLPMAAASAIWYGGITLLGSLLGAQWERILGILEGVNRTMTVAAAVLLALGFVWHWRARRRRAQERLWHATRDALDPAAPSFLEGTEIAIGSAREAAALLVLELAYADP